MLPPANVLKKLSSYNLLLFLFGFALHHVIDMCCVQEYDKRNDIDNKQLFTVDPASSGSGVAYPCNIRKVSANTDANDPFSLGQLESRDLLDPVIFVRSTDRNRELADLVAMKNLLDIYGSSSVELRSSNSYSKQINEMMLSEYIHTLPSAAGIINGGLANETFYLFGGNKGPLWDRVENKYVLPGCRHCDIAGAVIPGLGGHSSGVSFHFHGPGFSEVIHGAKRWFLYPPGGDLQSQADGTVSPRRNRLAPGFHPDMSVAQWVSDVYSKFEVNSADSPLECVIRPGEILFFPDRWVHATLNVEDYVFFISLFLDLQLMP